MFSIVSIDICGAVISASWGAFCFGYHMAVLNGPLEIISEQMHFNSNSLLKGFVVSSLLLGALVGSLSAGKYADLYGRRTTLLYNSIILVLGPLGCALATSPWILAAWRFICGCGVGTCSVLVPVFISEMSPDQYKGVFGTFNQLFICIGIFTALFTSLPLKLSSPYWWRFMFAFAIIPAALHSAGCWYFSTESRTRQSFHRETEKSFSSSDENLRVPAADLSIYEALSSPLDRSLILSGCLLFALRQFSGINMVVFYSSDTFRNAGVELELWASAAAAFVHMVGTAISSCLIVRISRKRLLLGSFTGMGFSMILLVYAFSSHSGISRAAPHLSIFGTFSFIFSFSLGCGPLPTLLLPEIFPPLLRARGTSLSLATHWASIFILGLIFLRMVEIIGMSMTYLFFSIVCFSAVFFIHNDPSFKSLQSDNDAL